MNLQSLVSQLGDMRGAVKTQVRITLNQVRLSPESQVHKDELDIIKVEIEQTQKHVFWNYTLSKNAL